MSECTQALAMVKSKLSLSKICTLISHLNVICRIKNGPREAFEIET